ncbi:DUF7507 domain-containing protein [Kitasatospora sp. NPDC004531]
MRTTRRPGRPLLAGALCALAALPPAAPAHASAEARPSPPLRLVGRIDPGAPLPDPVTAGTVLPYRFAVTNAGGAEIRDLVVSDPLLGAVVCPTTTLPADETLTCAGSYTVTAADVRRGFVADLAVADGDSDRGPVVSPEAHHVLPLNDGYGLLLEKHIDEDRVYLAGESARYTYTVTNTTDRTVTRLAVLDDRPTGARCASTTLSPRDTPGAVTTCTGSHPVTAADAGAGTLRSAAHATGSTPERAVTSPPDEQEIVVRGIAFEPPGAHRAPLLPMLLSAGLGVAGLCVVRRVRRRAPSPWLGALRAKR